MTVIFWVFWDFLHALWCGDCRELKAALRNPWPKDRTISNPREETRRRMAQLAAERKAGK